MTRWVFPAAVASVLLSGCVYYNSIYNAERSYADAERHRRAGRDSAAVANYRDAVRKAAEGYRRDPGGEWADDALFLVGRARLRLGETAAAGAALEEAWRLGPDAEQALAILVYQAIAAERTGDQERALRLVHEALRGLKAGPALADGHLLRGNILLSEGQVDAGWWDLDRAPAVDPTTRVESALLRFRWAVELDEPRRAAEAVSRLLNSSGGLSRLDTMVVLTREASRRWGPAAAVDLLAGADSAVWGREGRAKARLTRAVFMEEAGDTAAAASEARAVARGAGEGAAEARLWMARTRLARARDLAELETVRGILLPGSDEPVVESLLEVIDRLARYSELGLEEPLGWFAAAEVARDELNAPVLARGLFLAYADADPLQPWSAKALLAAIDVSPDEGDRAWLRGRLEVHSRSPYVLAARGASAPGFEALEEDLALRLSEMRSR